MALLRWEINFFEGGEILLTGNVYGRWSDKYGGTLGQ